jgi:photosystem II stability/assembly factor-like uncharacterized protein
MPMDAAGSDATTGDVLLMVGTMKGAFLIAGSAKHDRWRVDGPHFPGDEVYAVTLDQRIDPPTLWAAPGSPFWGANLLRSRDLGASWSGQDEHPVKFPDGSDLSLARIWQIAPGPADDPDRIYLGVEPSCVFESRDGGASWSAMEGFLHHQHRPYWTPGKGGLCLHTILQHPHDADRMLVAFSTGGVYGTDDGGASWSPRNRGIRAEFLPDKHPEFGQCVHKVVHHPARPERLFLQNHWGLYRSDDWAESWIDVANGVPSDFGFAMVMHPRDPDTVYIVPLESDRFRCTPEAKLRVYRTRDAGGSWHPLGQGLPQVGAFETVLRDGMSTDGADPAGIYFGTRSGKVYASADEGDSWTLVTEGLPAVVCVKAAVIQ